MYSVYNELSLSRDYNAQVTSRHHATYTEPITVTTGDKQLETPRTFTFTSNFMQRSARYNSN